MLDLNPSKLVGDFSLFPQEVSINRDEDWASDQFITQVAVHDSAAELLMQDQRREVIMTSPNAASVRAGYLNQV